MFFANDKLGWNTLSSTASGEAVDAQREEQPQRDLVSCEDREAYNTIAQ